MTRRQAIARIVVVGTVALLLLSNVLLLGLMEEYRLTASRALDAIRRGCPDATPAPSPRPGAAIVRGQWRALHVHGEHWCGFDGRWWQPGPDGMCWWPQ